MAGSLVAEKRIHVVRWLLTTGWLLIIGSLFFDPFTARFTEPDHPWSPLRLPATCVEVQGRCLTEAAYPLGTTLFWGAVVPSAIFVLLVFGHELWRRICPLSFLSQIPRALGWQRQIETRNPKSGVVRRQVARLPATSWLARHYSALQFGWLFVGLCGRILFFNADRLVLAGWLLFTIAAAIAVGWLYGGKAWCQYFCPMAPVQAIYSTPAGLLGSHAHQSPRSITQSMCRTVLPNGDEQSACVACQQPCIDIDAERMYWARLATPAFAFERYAYVGLVLGYFLYYYLYAGNWDYYFSGAWVRQPDQLAHLLSPGLFLFGKAINLPRLVAVPMVLGFFTWLGWLSGRAIEAWMRRGARHQGEQPEMTRIRHRVFVVATFVVFNLFFLFAGRPLLLLAPDWVQYLFDVAVVVTSSLWLVRSWHRSPALYDRENLAERFRRQLEKLGLDVSRFLEGRSLRDLSPDEVYVLARILPGFGSEQRLEAYKGVVHDALQEGYVNAASSLEVLRRMRQELGISDDAHRQLLDQLGVEDPALLDPDQRRSLEDQVRLSGYRRSLERLLRLQNREVSRALADGVDADPIDPNALEALRRLYSISAGEDEQAREQLAPAEAAARRTTLLLQRLGELSQTLAALEHPTLSGFEPLVALARDQLLQRQELCGRSILRGLGTLGSDPVVPELAQRLATTLPGLVEEVLSDDARRRELSAEVLQVLQQPPFSNELPQPTLSAAQALAELDRLTADPNPSLALAAVVLSAALDAESGRRRAGQLAQDAQAPAWLRQTAAQLLSLEGPWQLAALPELEKRVVLATSDFFRHTWSDTLDALAEKAEIRAYQSGELITETGDTCRELLLLIEGSARVEHRNGGRCWLEQMRPGQVLDELEVLSNSHSESTIAADMDGTRVLAVPVDSFDATLERDPEFARRVLALETRQLQRLTREVGPAESRPL